MLLDKLDQGLPIVNAWKHYSEDRNKQRLLEWALDGPESDLKMSSLLWLAIEAHDWDLAELFFGASGQTLPRENDPASGPIAAAIQDFGDAPDAVEWLITHGARVDARGMNDWTPLHLASLLGYLGVVRVLISHGANIDDQTRIDGGYTPLMEACLGGHKTVVEFLLQKGANPGIVKTYEGGSAVRVATNSGHLEITALINAWTDSRAAWKRKRASKKSKK